MNVFERRAPRAYCEQVGLNRHRFPSRGEIKIRYAETRRISNLLARRSNRSAKDIIVQTLYGKTLSAFFPATAKNGSAADGRFPGAEAVLILSFSVAGLICSLHSDSKKARENTNTARTSQNQKFHKKTQMVVVHLYIKKVIFN